ncbi:unnamed protein product [Didymodactylos carnosus]|uniref:Uncharacterized protein n=1 Tax=Didymodactylos carnosus TaxID=1234261 RepID=A0A815BIP2_9BILA|nr:unnamed protein product [Didymodactylos carnosus]CAF1270881.1 unnamed protein product [Didymodactylos carnosus]CAF3680221.1 unnamed protein product [Didymodactylos carnosus]CAF4058989.1 unnamed protein product [Didymodactylos carnosus]
MYHDIGCNNDRFLMFDDDATGPINKDVSFGDNFSQESETSILNNPLADTSIPLMQTDTSSTRDLFWLDSLVVPVLNDNPADSVEKILSTGFVNEINEEASFQPRSNITFDGKIFSASEKHVPCINMKQFSCSLDDFLEIFGTDNISQQIAAYPVEPQLEVSSTSTISQDDNWKLLEIIPDIRHLIPNGWHAYVRVTRILTRRIHDLFFLHPYNLNANDADVKENYSSLYHRIDQEEMKNGLKRFSRLIMIRMKQTLLSNRLLSYSPNEIVPAYAQPCNNDQPKKLIEDFSLKTCLLAFDIVFEAPDGLYYPTGISCISHEIVECKQNEQSNA